MDLIHIILSVFLRLSPAVRKLSIVSSGRNPQRHDLVELAFWIPLVGWVSVSVQHRPHAKWLVWRVREVTAFRFSMLNLEQKNSWKSGTQRREGTKRSRPSPDDPGQRRD